MSSLKGEFLRLDSFSLDQIRHQVRMCSLASSTGIDLTTLTFHGYTSNALAGSDRLLRMHSILSPTSGKNLRYASGISTCRFLRRKRSSYFSFLFPYSSNCLSRSTRSDFRFFRTEFFYLLLHQRSVTRNSLWPLDLAKLCPLV